MDKVYIVILSYADSKKGWKILEVFNTMKKAGKYIREKYEHYNYDSLSDNFIYIPKFNKENKSFIEIHERLVL